VAVRGDREEFLLVEVTRWPRRRGSFRDRSPHRLSCMTTMTTRRR